MGPRVWLWECPRLTEGFETGYVTSEIRVQASELEMGHP